METGQASQEERDAPWRSARANANIGHFESRNIHHGGFDGVWKTFDRADIRAGSIQHLVSIVVDPKPRLEPAVLLHANLLTKKFSRAPFACHRI
jgi:hypothetical protein